MSILKPQWLLSVGIDWLALRLGLGILCMTTDSTFLSQSFLDCHCLLMNLLKRAGGNNKHLMTGPKGNSEFCFPETLNVPRGEAEGNIEVEGKQNSLFPEGPVFKCFVIPPNSK